MIGDFTAFLRGHSSTIPNLNTDKRYIFSSNTPLDKFSYFNDHSVKVSELLPTDKKYSLEIYPEIISAMKEQDGGKSVCARVLTPGESIAECMDCRMDGSCIICLDCYKHGDHEGHRVVIKTCVGGCCDCGDVQAWRKEGFCSRHSGFKEGEGLEPNLAHRLTEILHDLFYIYFRVTVFPEGLSARNLQRYSQFLITLLLSFNEQGSKHNQYLSDFLALKPKHLLTPHLNADTYLQTILTYRLFKSDLKQWEKLFVSMFSCYAFKKQLLAAYFYKFDDIYCEEDESLRIGENIACQILTSHGLVKEYIEAPSSLPLTMTIQSIEEQKKPSIYMHDLMRFFKLSDDVGRLYWIFHITMGGLPSLFAPYEKLKEQLLPRQGAKKTNPILLMTRHSSYMHYESLLLTLFQQILPRIRDKIICISILIRFLFDRLANEIEEETLVIYKPYQRVLGLTLCAYFQCDLSSVRIDPLRGILQLEQEELCQHFEQFARRAFRTYIFYNEIVTHKSKGLSSSLYFYLYYYQIKSKFLQAVDAVWLKMAIILSQTPLLIDLHSALSLDSGEDLSVSYITCILKEIHVLYLGSTMEIYIANLLKLEVPHLKAAEEMMVAKYMTQHGGTVPYADMIEFGKSFLHEFQTSIKQLLRPYCIFNKTSKRFVLKEEKQSMRPFNMKDFRTAIQNKSAINDPEVSLDYLRGNSTVFRLIWGEENTRELILHSRKSIKTKDAGEMISLASALAKLYCFMSHQHCEARLGVKTFVEEELFSHPEVEKGTEDCFKNALSCKSSHQAQHPHFSPTKEPQKNDALQEKKRKKKEAMMSRQAANMAAFKTEMEQEIETEESFCVICRKGGNVSYLCLLGQRNHEKLLGLGRGVNTLSFTTCYHVFHIECLIGADDVNEDYERLYMCAVCKSFGNLFLPLNGQESAIKEIWKVAKGHFEVRNRILPDMFEELVKCFYHYALVALVDFNAACKLSKLYSIIFKALQTHPSELKKVQAKYIEGNLSLVYQTWSQSYKEQLSKKDLQAMDEMQHSYEDEEEGGVYSSGEGDSSEEAELIQQLSPELVSGPSHFEQVHSSYSPHLRDSLDTLFRILTGTDAAHTQGDSRIRIALRRLVGEQNEQPVDEDLGYAFRSLPAVYFFPHLTCGYCEDISNSLCICLLCEWQCCKKCPKKGVKFHTEEKHGEVGAYMDRNSAWSFVGGAISQKVACLYMSEFGDNFSIQKDWSQYELNQSVLQAVRRKLIYE